MKTIRPWTVSVIALVLAGCMGDPTCEDLATCPLSQTPSPPADHSDDGGTPDAGSMIATEDCANGVDDDGDGKTDCVDPDCTTDPTCDVQLPLTFDGFTVISILTLDAVNPTCTDGSNAAILYQNPNEQVCAACSCDASAASCSGADIALDVQSDACTFQDYVFNPGIDECVSIDFFSFGIPEVLQSVATVGNAFPTGQCAATGGAPITSPPMKTKVAACKVKNPNTVVLENDERLCIYADGHVPVCPTGWDAVATNAFTGFVDDRQGCTPCGCVSGCTGGEYEVFEQLECSGTGVAISMEGGCGAIMPTSMFSILGKAPTGTCSPTGGEATGKVIPTGEKTFCCKS